MKYLKSWIKIRKKVRKKQANYMKEKIGECDMEIKCLETTSQFLQFLVQTSPRLMPSDLQVEKGCIIEN